MMPIAALASVLALFDFPLFFAAIFLSPYRDESQLRANTGLPCCTNVCAVPSTIKAAALQYFIHGGKWILLPIRNLRRQLRQACFAARSAQGPLEQPGFEQFDQTIFPMLDVFSLALPARFKMFSKFRHRLGQFLNALVLRRYRPQDRR